MTPDYNICDFCKNNKVCKDSRLRVVVDSSRDAVGEITQDVVFIDLCETCASKVINRLFLRAVSDSKSPSFEAGKALVSFIKNFKC